MTARAMRADDAPMPIAKPIRKRRDWAAAPIEFRRQISEGKKLLSHKWGTSIPPTEAAVQDVGVLLDLLAVYTNGEDQIDTYLAFETGFDQLTRDRLMAVALANAPRGYTPQQLAELWRVDWKTRKFLDLRQIDAIDRPPEHVLEELDRQRDVDYSRTYRAKKKSGPKKQTEAQRRRAKEVERRIAALTKAIGPTGSCVRSITAELAKKIERGPFADVKPENLPRVIRELVERNRDAFRTATKAWPDRPDLRPQLWVFRK